MNSKILSYLGILIVGIAIGYFIGKGNQATPAPDKKEIADNKPTEPEPAPQPEPEPQPENQSPNPNRNPLLQLALELYHLRVYVFLMMMTLAFN